MRIFVLDSPILPHHQIGDASVLADADRTMTSSRSSARTSKLDVRLREISVEISVDETWVVFLRNNFAVVDVITQVEAQLQPPILPTS